MAANRYPSTASPLERGRSRFSIKNPVGEFAVPEPINMNQRSIRNQKRVQLVNK